MSQAIFNAIENRDLDALEQSLEGGASPLTVNEAGQRPLTLVASLIKQSFTAGDYEEEERYKKMAAILIVHGAHDSDLQHACGEVSNLGRHVCRYVIDHALDQQESDPVARLIEAKRLWFEEDDADAKAELLDAIATGDREKVAAMMESGRMHYAYEQ